MFIFFHCTTCPKAKPVQNFKQAVPGKSVKTNYSLFVFSWVGTVCSQTLKFQGACSHMFANVSKKSSIEPKYRSNRRERLRGGDPYATDRRKNYTICHILSSTSYQQDLQDFARRQERQRAVAQNCVTEWLLPLNALSFCSLCLGILEPSGHVFIYHPAGLQCLPVRFQRH